MEPDQELLCRIAYEVHLATEALSAGERSEDEMPTSSDLAKAMGMKLEKLKKKLRLLIGDNVVRAISYTPKRYRLDYFAVQQLDEDHPLHEGLLGIDSPYQVVYSDAENK